MVINNNTERIVSNTTYTFSTEYAQCHMSPVLLFVFKKMAAIKAYAKRTMSIGVGFSTLPSISNGACIQVTAAIAIPNIISTAKKIEIKFFICLSID